VSIVQLIFFLNKKDPPLKLLYSNSCRNAELITQNIDKNFQLLLNSHLVLQEKECQLLFKEIKKIIFLLKELLK
jgi:hypothetical protein